MIATEQRRADAEMEALRNKWAPQWCLWRSRGSDGAPKSWCATRRGEGRELSMTLMEPTAGELEKALVERSEQRPMIYG